MGYRSDGAVWLPEEAYKLLPSVLKKDLEDNWVKDYDNESVWSFSGWKWYDSYDDIQMWEKYFVKCHKDDIEFDFVRIGEDSDDIQLETGMKFYVNLAWEFHR